MKGFFSAAKSVAVTPTDTTTTLFTATDALWIGVGGTITYVPADTSLPMGTAATVSTTVPAGLFPVSCVRVAVTTTSATGIVALYGAS